MIRAFHFRSYGFDGAGPAIAAWLVVVVFGVAGQPIGLRADETPSTIKADEQVLFFPTAARMSADEKMWEAELHGWIFEPEQGDVLRATAIDEVRDLLDLDPKHPNTEVFEERVRLFLVDNERDKRIGVRLAGETFVMKPSAADGHFTGVVRFKVEAVAEDLRKYGIVPFGAMLDKGDKRKFGGEIYCLKDEGTSVISDIDDTIKLTGVRSKATLVWQTFFREFERMDAIAEVYQKWAKDGATFHYVSAAPWQLYEPLSEYVVNENFPFGTFHLKRLRLKDETFVALFADPVAYKLGIIEPFIKQFPKRKFVLVGDSGEKDPEIYGAVAAVCGAGREDLHPRCDGRGEGGGAVQEGV